MEINDLKERRLNTPILNSSQRFFQFTKILKQSSLSKNDRVATYMPMIPKLTIFILTYTHIESIHSVVFGEFSAAALVGRVQDAESKILLTADRVFR
ncbi:MAG: hypothetical protein ACMUEM_01240 [Flavobacteriales bacterium AspAUS03]